MRTLSGSTKYHSRQWLAIALVVAGLAPRASEAVVAAPISTSQSFAVKGQLFDSGSNPLNATVSLTFGIYDPNGLGCLLYEETQASINVGANNGIFSASVGSAT